MIATVQVSMRGIGGGSELKVSFYTLLAGRQIKWDSLITIELISIAFKILFLTVNQIKNINKI